jgi:hypothetical protein
VTEKLEDRMSDDIVHGNQVALSIIIPTIGRQELRRILGELAPQLSPQDEVLVVGDGPQPAAREIAGGFGSRVKYWEHGSDHCWGYPQRNWVMPRASGSHLMFFDDDDRGAPAALQHVRDAARANPGRPLMFREIHEEGLIWGRKRVELSNVSTQLFVVPNDPARLGKWGQRYVGDYDFVVSTLALYPGGEEALVWREEVIAVHGTLSFKDEVDRWSWKSGWFCELRRILEVMASISGWLSVAEGELLFTFARRALREVPAQNIVEVGSFHGKSTVVLAAAARTRGAAKVVAIDPHLGRLMGNDGNIRHEAASLIPFLENLKRAGVSDAVIPVQQHSFDVHWEKPIALLFIDGLHDYENVSRDFAQFEHWIAPHGYVAFHDCPNSDFPEVTRFADEVIRSGRYCEAARADSLLILRKVR